KKQYFLCSYGEGNRGTELCSNIRADSFSSDSQAELVVDTILKPIGLGVQRNFILISCPRIDNAMAVIIKDENIRYILYDNEFVERLNKRTNTDWASWSILAHEIGHHLQGHTLSDTNLEQSRKDELAADYFSGFILSRLDASLEQAQAAVRALPDVDNENISRHPKNQRRLDAIESGYNAAKSKSPIELLPLNSANNNAQRLNLGKVTIGSTGYINGLNGRLNPILDSLNRTYLYADNIAIEGGKNQPVTFSPNQPFLVEDSLGNQFELKVLSITNDSSTIEYRQLPSAIGTQRPNLNLKVVDQNSRSIKGADVLAIFADGTYLRGVTDSEGNARIQQLKNRDVTIYCAHQNYTAFYKEGQDVYSNLI